MKTPIWLKPTPNDFDAFEKKRLDACDLWGYIIWTVAKRKKPDTEFIFIQLIERASWGATEIDRGDLTKYALQRYVSACIKQRIEDTCSRGGRINKSSFWENARHEHVITTKEARPLLMMATDKTEGDVIKILRNLVACIVTKEEGYLLDAYESGGWERYRKAGIEVWDRKTNTQADLQALAKGVTP